MNVKLVPLQEQEKETFIRNNQIAFKKAVVEQFGPFEEEIIPREDILRSFGAEGAESYKIVLDGKMVGGTVLAIHPDTNRNELQLLFVNVDCHSKGIGFAAWQQIEKLHPETEVWETFTPYFDRRNIHFYINKCGFQAVEFFCEYHSDPNMKNEESLEGPDEMFRFVKVMKE